MAKRERLGGLVETFKTLLWAALIALTIRTAAYEPFNIPSGSMIPTLLVGDYLFVSKFSYGYSRYSLPFSLPLIPGRIFFEEPKRGDVAVFRLPTNNKIDYVKRLIGLPGDRIQMIKGVLHINEKPVKRERTTDYEFSEYGNLLRAPRYVETLPNGKKYHILEKSGDRGIADNTPVFTVPEGHYFAMGDNRDNSIDSRFLGKVGYIPKKNLVGRAEFLFFSIDGSFWKFWKWGRSIRFSRLFDGIN